MNIVNESINIRPGSNGFVVRYDWVEKKEDTQESPQTDWKDETSVFKSWEEVMDYLNNNPLEVTK